jgi:hypothetical protein
MSTPQTWLTQEAADRLQAELEPLEGPGRRDVTAKIEAARAEGDLKENGGYHAARDEQGKMDARIRQLNCGLIELGRAADFVFMDRAQHTAGKTLLESVQLGDIPGIGMVMIDGIVRCGRSRNTPPAQDIPEVVSGH